MQTYNKKGILFFWQLNVKKVYLIRIAMVNNNLMTIEDLADYLKVTRRTIYDWLKHNKIPALKLVGQWRFKKDKIDDWLEGQTQQH